MSQTDAMLFDNWLRERDADAFKTLATRYATMVYETCRRILNNPSEAEDVTQECFVILAATSKPIGDYLAPWLHRVAYNRSLARLRTEHRRREREIRFASEQPVARDMEWNEVGAFVDEAIAELPEKLREPIVAYFLDAKSHEAIAQTLGIPRSTVTYRVDKGIECLRKSLKGKGVAITTAALVGSVKGSTATAVPGSLLANLGKLALSGSSHIALPAAAPPLAKTTLGLWTAKTLLTATASLAIVLVGGWQVYSNAYSSGVRDAQTQQVSTSSNAPAASQMTPGQPPSADASPSAALSLVPPREAVDKPSASPAPSDPSARDKAVSEPVVMAQGGLPSFSDIGNTVSQTWQRLRMTLTGANGRRSSCQNNLKQLGLVCKMFANESPGQVFPLLDPRAGHLVFANHGPNVKSIYPEYLSDLAILKCPSDFLRTNPSGPSDLTLLDDNSYFYLGYVVRNIDDLNAFAEAYKDRIARGLSFDTDLDTPRGKLYRLREGVEQFFVTDLNNPSAAAKLQSEIPVLVDLPNHEPGGGNVLYMDGHVEFRRLAHDDQFPMTDECMRILQSLSAMKDPTPPAK